jgi:hypothetical protein
MKNNDIRVNMDNLSKSERELLINIIKKANSRILPIYVKVGDTFKIADIEFIRFPEVNGMVPIVAKDFVFVKKIDDNSNNFATSSLLKKLQNEILTKIEDAVGADNVLEFETDLISLDGLKDYGKVKSKISLPTFDFYRENINIFNKYSPNEWWWLATPWSTPTHGYSSSVCGVSSRGTIDGGFCDYHRGVRPFLILNSLIFAS